MRGGGSANDIAVRRSVVDRPCGKRGGGRGDRERDRGLSRGRMFPIFGAAAKHDSQLVTHAPHARTRESSNYPPTQWLISGEECTPGKKGREPLMSTEEGEPETNCEEYSWPFWAMNLPRLPSCVLRGSPAIVSLFALSSGHACSALRCTSSTTGGEDVGRD